LLFIENASSDTTNIMGPQLLVLGIAERAASVSADGGSLTKWNVLGLGRILLTNVFPMRMPPCSVALAIHSSIGRSIPRIVLVDDTGKELGFITIVLESDHLNVLEGKYQTLEPPVLLARFGWSLIFASLGNSDIVIERAGSVYFRADSSTGEILGQLDIVLVDPPPLTSERVAAIRSDPGARRAVRVEYGCRFCTKTLRAYAALERLQALESEGWTWFSELPENFECDCGKTVMPLETARRNLHAYLGLPAVQSESVHFVPLYEQQSLRSLRASLLRLLSSNPPEEALQKFIERNPVLLHPFPATRLFVKPPLLTDYFADFAIVSPKKELILVEIERTSTRILKKDGGVAAELGHAFDQVRSWLQVTDEHLLAVLDSLKVDRAEVSRVRGVVIAGRDIGTDPRHLRRLKGQDWGRVELLTFDDLLYSLDSLIDRMSKI
jgi:hypothetical protein